MRFTDSLVRVFSNVALIGPLMPAGSEVAVGALALPPMVVRDFNFSSATEF